MRKRIRRYNPPVVDPPPLQNLSLSALTDAGRCKECGYPLRALKVPRCPECGRGFDPADPDTMDLPEHLRKPKPSPPPRPFGDSMRDVSIVMSVFAVMNLVAHHLLTGIVLGIGWILIGIDVFRWAFASPQQREQRPEGYRHWRWALRMALVLSALSFIRAHSCCHATTVWFGPVGISHSSCGGPCHDGVHNGGRHLSGNWYLAW